MVAKGGLLVLILVALTMRTCMSIKRSCAPLGYEEFELLMTYRDAEDTGLLWMYALYTPNKPRKLYRCQKLWRKRCLILMLLLIAGNESNPVSVINNIFIIIQAALFGKVKLCILS